MQQRRGVRPDLVLAAAGVACLALAAPAFAAAAHPRGNNGTVKIGDADVDGGNANRPHVPCEFDVRFYNFDTSQTATITFSLHPQGVPLWQEIRVVSNDPAGDGLDEDAVFHYSGADFGLGRFRRQAQGYHVKLDISAEDLPGGRKHKVFWLDCPAKTVPPTSTAPKPSNPLAAPPPSEKNSDPPRTKESEAVPEAPTGGALGAPDPSPTAPSPTTTGPTPTSPTEGATELPLTGTGPTNAMALTGIALTGVGLTLLGMGSTLMLVRRRREFVA